MLKSRTTLGVLVVALAAATVFALQSQSTGGLDYPKTRKVDQVDDYHGTKVADPYRWLEDLDSEETAAWVKAQNKVTFGYLATIPAREKIQARLTKLWDYEKYGIPRQKGGRYFFSKNDGLQNQSVIYTADTLDAQPRVLLDPNKLSADGTVALSSYAITDDGKLMAYGISESGSDWRDFKVRDVATGKDLPDHLKWVKFSGASWTKDGKGFYYSRYDEPKDGNPLSASNFYQKLFYHRLGTTQSDDELIYQRSDKKDWGFGGSVTEDGRYLIISVRKGTERKNRVYYQDLQSEGREVVKLLDDFDAQYTFIGNDGPLFWFNTNLDAPRGRVIAIDIANPARENWKEIIAQRDEALRGVSLVNDTFIASYLKDAKSLIKLYDLGGKHVRDIELPGQGTAAGFGGQRKDTETFYSYNSFSLPPTIYRYNLTTGKSTVFKRPQVEFHPDDYETKQVFYASKDGTQVPMFITHKKGITLDGNNPTYLYGYAGFNIPLTP
ncbi:MAG: S9 family peptidase, partial [Planctomycetes bacterium]|nr:S9 family peptidase [Planctomycetota bacterium]